MRQPDAIRAMFSAIVGRYDLLNRLLSFSLDETWRHKAAEALTNPPSNSLLALDACCGTGDLAFELMEKGGEVVGVDFSHPMLIAACAKAQRRDRSTPFVEADVLRLPFPNDLFDVIGVAFGVRNVESLRFALQEFGRVLKPGGSLSILEFSQPTNPMVRYPYLLYLRYFLPIIGSLISGHREAYTYLSQSIRGFPPPEAIVSLLHEAGFAKASATPLTAGIVTLYTAQL